MHRARRPRRRSSARSPTWSRTRAATAQAGRSRSRSRSSDGHAALTVTDEGAGLRRTQAEHAFERFWRAILRAAGSGLGLAIVRATAERHGGRAYAEGARFTIELRSQESSQSRRVHLGCGTNQKGSAVKHLPHTLHPLA